MKLVAVTLASLIALVAAAGATATRKPVKPKPWQWTTAKAQIRVTAARPIVGGDIGDQILAASCVGQGKHVSARFSRFLCETRWGGPNGSYTSKLTLRVLAVGSGKLCVVTSADGRAVPPPGPMIKTERACP